MTEVLGDLLDDQARLRIVRAWWADKITADQALLLLIDCDLLGVDLIEAPAT